MKHYLCQNPMMQNMQMTKFTTLVDPYVVETLGTIIGESVVVETIRGSIQGILEGVKPDHIILKTYDGDTTFYIRIQQIVSVMPT